jgi:polyhydroxyalkanoate synthesis regulator phasin
MTGWVNLNWQVVGIAVRASSICLICLALPGGGGVSCKQIHQGGMNMQDYIKRLKLLGVGLFYMGKEKVEESIAELIKMGEISEKEGRALVNDLVKKSQAATKDMEARIHEMISDVHDKLHTPMKKEIDVLKKRIEKLEKAGAKNIEKLEKAGAKKIAKSSKKIVRTAKKIKL